MSKTIINQCNSGHRFIIQGENKIGEIITVKVEKLPDSKYEFIKWEDGRTDNPRTFDIRECGKHYVAIFEEIDIPTPVPEPELCDKAKIYYEWFAKNVTYDNLNVHYQSTHLPYSAFVKKAATCDK